MSLTPADHSLGTPFVELHSIDSTNNYALAQIHANLAQPGTCYFAHEQTAGKGQRSRTWASEKGANILMSVILKPSFLQTFEQFHLSACVAVATKQFLSNYVSADLRIKWPNDLYWKNQKIGGILIENIIGGMRNDGLRIEIQDNPVRDEQPIISSQQSSNWRWAVIGIGININQEKFAEDIKNPVSLKQITARNFNAVELAKELCKTIDRFYKQLKNDGFKSILKFYNQALYKKDELAKFRRDNRNFHAMVRSVHETGQLIIEHSVEEKINFGEVEWILEEKNGK